MLEKFQAKFTEVNKSVPIVKRLLKSIVYKNEAVIVDLCSDKYIFSYRKLSSRKS